jgi:hypothetical protein
MRPKAHSSTRTNPWNVIFILPLAISCMIDSGVLRRMAADLLRVRFGAARDQC